MSKDVADRAGCFRRETVGGEVKKSEYDDAKSFLQCVFKRKEEGIFRFKGENVRRVC